MTALRTRFLQDMQLHGFSPKTQACYVGAVRGLNGVSPAEPLVFRTLDGMGGARQPCILGTCLLTQRTTICDSAGLTPLRYDPVM